MVRKKSTIYNKDSRYLLEIEDGSVDYVITSPPFNIGHQYNYYVDKVTLDDITDLYETFILSTQRVLKSSGIFIIDIADVVVMENDIVFAADLIKHICSKVGLRHVKTIPYLVKELDIQQNICIMRNSNICTHSNCEQIMYFVKGDIGDLGIKSFVYDLEYDYSESSDKAFWPKKLIDDILNTITVTNRIILDPFMGSGELGKLAIKMNAKFIGYDIDGEILTLNGWEID